MYCPRLSWMIIAFLILVFVLIGVPIIVYKAVVKPKNPTFTVEQASVTGFNLTSDGHFTAFFDILLRAHNPNHKLKLGYENIRVSIFKDKQNLAEDSVFDFKQRTGNVTLLHVQPVSLNVGLKKDPIFDFGLESEMGYIDFDVFTSARLNGDNLEVNCRHVAVNITSSTSPVNNNNNNLGKFQSTGCSILVYRNDNNFQDPP